MSPAFSRESKNSLENSIPKFILCEHPPHFHRLVVFKLKRNQIQIQTFFQIKIEFMHNLPGNFILFHF